MTDHEHEWEEDGQYRACALCGQPDESEPDVPSEEGE